MPTPPPDTSFWLPGNIFEYLVTALFAVLAWIFKRHLKEDDDRFKDQETRIALLHAENISSIQQFRGDLLLGQSNLATQFTAIRRTLDDVLLQRRE